MDVKTFEHVHSTRPQDPPSWRELYEAKEEKYRALEKKLEAYQLVASFAKDVVEYWPSMSFKTIRFMIPKMDALKEALDLVK
jgi:hypothetical protein